MSNTPVNFLSQHLVNFSAGLPSPSQMILVPDEERRLQTIYSSYNEADFRFAFPVDPGRNGKDYPARFLLSPSEVSWDVSVDRYHPPYYVAPSVLKNDDTVNPQGWADPEDLALTKARREIQSHAGVIRYDVRGVPLHPMGRTGIAGRGLLGRWGANFALDAVVTRLNPESQKLEVLLIQRKDSGMWATPGGMLDKGELPIEAARRELEEETAVNIPKAIWMHSAAEILTTVTRDRRNTDNAWIESTAYFVHLMGDVKLQGGDDALDARWIEITRERLDALGSTHRLFIVTALGKILENV